MREVIRKEKANRETNGLGTKSGTSCCLIIQCSLLYTFAFQNSSSLFLKESSVSAITMVAGRLFQSSITLFEKLFMRGDFVAFPFLILYICPELLIYSMLKISFNVLSLPLNILYR